MSRLDRLASVAKTIMIGSVPPAAVALTYLVLGIETRHLRGDPAELLRAPFYTGALSQVGLFLWASAATVSAFASTIAKRRRTFLLVSAGLSSVLLMDDAFLLHDHVLGDRLGVPEWLTFSVYVLAVTGYVARFRRTLLTEREFPLLAVAGSFFAASIGIDVLETQTSGFGFVEDSLKFVGIWCWTIALARISHDAIRETMRLIEDLERGPLVAPTSDATAGHGDDAVDDPSESAHVRVQHTVGTEDGDQQPELRPG